MKQKVPLKDLLNLKDLDNKTFTYSKKYRVSKARKGLYKYTFSTYDFYHTLPKEVKELVTKEAFIKLTAAYYNRLTDIIIKDRKRIIMPFSNGEFRMRKKKVSDRRFIDYQKTKEYNTLVRHHNLESFSHYFKFYWTPTKYGLLKLYRFTPNLAVKKKITAEIRKCNRDLYTKDYEALT